MTFAEKLKTARDRVGYTQEELGKMIGMTGQSIWLYEAKGRNCPAATRRKIEEVLRVEPYSLDPDIEKPIGNFVKCPCCGAILALAEVRATPIDDSDGVQAEELFSESEV